MKFDYHFILSPKWFKYLFILIVANVLYDFRKALNRFYNHTLEMLNVVIYIFILDHTQIIIYLHLIVL